MLIVSTLKQTNKEFTALLSQWFNKWENFLSEHSINKLTDKTYYTHKYLHNAYHSLQSNLSSFLTW